jgi:hypothetical protein
VDRIAAASDGRASKVLAGSVGSDGSGSVRRWCNSYSAVLCSAQLEPTERKRRAKRLVLGAVGTHRAESGSTAAMLQ